MVKRIPDRWRNYDACKWIPIKDERIISFKTPLSTKYDHETPNDDGILESERFTPADLIGGLEEKGFKLGLVLDFTFTKRYYDPEEFSKEGIKYHKMMCPGHEIPNENDVKRFEYEVHSFLDKDKTGKLVGVHCTHGLNRTGYMVCRYLIDCRGYLPDDAIQAFNEARGYPLERENYLADLKTRTPGHGVDYTPENEDLDNSTQHDRNRRQHSRDYPRTDGSQHSRNRQHHPQWQQRHSDQWTSTRDYNYERDQNDRFAPNWGAPPDRYTGDKDLRNILNQPRRSYDRPPPHFNMYCDQPTNHRDSYYNNRPYSSDSYSYERREFDNSYNRNKMPRRHEDYRTKKKYQPYSKEGSHFNRQWRRDNY